MLDLLDQDTSSYVVFGCPQKNVSEGRARAGIFDIAIDLACLLHHYWGSHVLLPHTTTLPLDYSHLERKNKHCDCIRLGICAGQAGATHQVCNCVRG